jgi:hypothetical protein
MLLCMEEMVMAVPETMAVGETHENSSMVCRVLHYGAVRASLSFFGGIALSGQSMTEMSSFDIIHVHRMSGLYSILGSG